MPELNQLYKPKEDGSPALSATFMSGSGSNVIEVLELEGKLGGDSPFKVVAIATDRSKEQGSNAPVIAEKYGKPFEELNLKAHYAERGLKTTSLKTPEGQKAREDYTSGLRRILAPYEIDFGIFGGFEPLTNIVADFPCLNIHPGDLSYLDGQGNRTLVGLHTIPIEAAIRAGLDYLRSCVILAMPYTGDGREMDNGPILISGPKLGLNLDVPRKVLIALSGDLQNQLKVKSDWVSLKLATLLTAQGRFALSTERHPDGVRKVYFDGAEMPYCGIDLDSKANSYLLEMP